MFAVLKVFYLKESTSWWVIVQVPEIMRFGLSTQFTEFTDSILLRFRSLLELQSLTLNTSLHLADIFYVGVWQGSTCWQISFSDDTVIYLASLIECLGCFAKWIKPAMLTRSPWISQHLAALATLHLCMTPWEEGRTIVSLMLLFCLRPGAIRDVL